MLARDYHVFAFCKLGFGLSDKPVHYSATVWKSQTVAFLENVVKRPAVVVGNSIDRFTSLYTVAEAKDMVRGVVLLMVRGDLVMVVRRWRSPI